MFHTTAHLESSITSMAFSFTKTCSVYLRTVPIWLHELSTPFLHHLANLAELDEVQASGGIKRHHFNMLRCIMEQTAIYCGLEGWSDCIKFANTDPDRALHKRMIDVMSHAD